MIYISKFDPTDMLGSTTTTSVTFSYPFISYISRDTSGSGKLMRLQKTISSSSDINYAQVQILSDVTVSSKQKQMLFEA